MTILEQRFMEQLPHFMADLRDELKGIRDELKTANELKRKELELLETKNEK